MIKESINALVKTAHQNATKAGWWLNRDVRDTNVVPALLCLIHSEVSEAMEAHRKDLKDDKLPHRMGIEVELADAVIRICDLAGAMDMDLGGAIEEKMAYNKDREDHKIHNRIKVGGKAF